MPRIASIVAAIFAIGSALVLIVMLALMLAILDRVGAAPRALGDVTGRLGAASSEIARAVEDAGQRARDTLDPSHPPRGPLRQDVEIDELRQVEPGGTIAVGSDRELRLTAIRKRVPAESADLAQYALVRDQLRTPRETRVLGVVVNRTDDARDRYLYKGQVFRAGRAFYKVNWIAFEPPRLAIVRLRAPDDAIGELAFAID